MNITPITLEVFKNKFASVAEEMGSALCRAAYSPNIKERRDFSCAVFDAAGDMVAQAAHIPVHLGSMPLSVAAVLEAMELAPGEMAMLNDPFRGGTHLPDITLVAPVYAGGDAPLFYVASRAHHADVGGMAAGSMPLSTSIFQEGLVIPPVKIVAAGEIVPDVMNLFLANVRTPTERQGDFAAQIMANRVGVARTEALVAAYGREAVTAMSAALMDYAERLMRAAIAAMPEGSYAAEDFLDDDGAGNADLAIRLTLSLADGEAELDFTDSDPQTAGCVNAVRAIALSAALYVLRALAGGKMPTNAGCMRPVTVTTKAGTLVDAKFPAAVAGGNVETSQRIVDVILAALAKALPERIPAASQGTMNNVAMGGFDPRTKKPFTYYETLAGGAGADRDGDGQSAVHSHMTNTRNTPVEALEYAYPLRVTRYAVRRNSGGPGGHVGGDGLVREVEALASMEATVLSERRLRGP
ncbi:MAG TPA: hydantoinase B/oxoprolinase family protein, partial [Solidesulfovibrio sp.]|nr:5-oxoprolinase [Desulfovibrio sp.]HML60241.1 hydantoinase B/oxoprolinase family protein [Solidesulfovibrio sp.]